MRAVAPDPGLAAIEAYLTWANRLEREGLIADRKQRPLTARLLRARARLLRAAATAERVDPTPEGLAP